MFTFTKKAKEKKQEKRDTKALAELGKLRSKVEPKVIKKISKKLSQGEIILGIVSNDINSYALKTSEGRFFVGGVQGLRVMETILTKDKIINVSKSGLLPTSIYIELFNGNIRVAQENNLAKADKLFYDIVDLVG